MNPLIRELKSFDYQTYIYLKHKITRERLGSKAGGSFTISIWLYARNSFIISTLEEISTKTPVEVLLASILSILKRLKTHKPNLIKVNVQSYDLAAWLNSEHFFFSGTPLDPDQKKIQKLFTQISILRDKLALKRNFIFFVNRGLNHNEKYDFYQFLFEQNLLKSNPLDFGWNPVNTAQIESLKAIPDSEFFLAPFTIPLT